MLRSILINIGVTVFIARLLVNRCIRHWFPRFVIDTVVRVYEKYIHPYLHSEAAVGNLGTSQLLFSAVLQEADVAPTYAVESPHDSQLNEMLSVIEDPIRGEIFQDLARKYLLSENVIFLLDVLAYRKKAEVDIEQRTVEVNDVLQLSAREIHSRYIAVGSENEVNVSSSIRSHIERTLVEWPKSEPLLHSEHIRVALENDKLKRRSAFEPAFKEVAHMLYQNIWHKFLAHEAELFAGSSGG